MNKVNVMDYLPRQGPVLHSEETLWGDYRCIT